MFQTTTKIQTSCQSMLTKRFHAAFFQNWCSQLKEPSRYCVLLKYLNKTAPIFAQKNTCYEIFFPFKGHEQDRVKWFKQLIVIRYNSVWRANQELVRIHNDAAHEELVKIYNWQMSWKIKHSVNSLANRLFVLNNKIPLNWLNLSMDT